MKKWITAITLWGTGLALIMAVHFADAPTAVGAIGLFIAAYGLALAPSRPAQNRPKED